MKRGEGLWIAVGGIAGTLARVAVVDWHGFGSAPAWSILAVNWAGTVILSGLMGLLLRKGIAATYRYALGVGFCGGFTNFAAFIAGLADLANVHRSAATLFDVGSSLGGVLLALLTLTWAAGRQTQSRTLGVAERVDREP